MAPFWLPLAPFWLPFGSLWLPFGSLWLPFGSLWLTFSSLWAPSRFIFSLLAAFWPRSCIFHVFELQVCSEMIFYENFRTECIFVGKLLRTKSGTAARAHNKREISKGNLLLHSNPLPPGPERNLAEGNLDPLRARRRPRRVWLRSLGSLPCTHLFVLYLSKIPSVGHLLVFYLQNVGPPLFFYYIVNLPKVILLICTPPVAK